MILTTLGADVRQLTSWTTDEGKGIDDYLYNKERHPESPLEPTKALADLVKKADDQGDFIGSLVDRDSQFVTKALRRVKMEEAWHSKFVGQFAQYFEVRKSSFGKYWQGESGQVKESATDIRGCLDHGAHCVQIDFTEGRLAVKLDPSGKLLSSFIALINRVLDQFSEEERKRIGVHTCPGGDRDSTHSADVDYSGLLPSLFSLDVGSFYMQLASELDRRRVLQIVRENLHPPRRVFVGVIDPINPKVETPQEVRDRVLEASDFIPLIQLGTTDDCGFSPFGDDLSTARETAFAKIRARVEGTQLAVEQLG